MAWGALRDKTAMTRLLILAALARGVTTLSEVARGLGITVQAVSAHGKRLVADGLLQNESGLFTVTPAGLQAIHEGLRGLRSGVDELAAQFAVIHATSAVAGSDIAEGAAVVLEMRDGDLLANAGTKGASRGRARHAAKRGEEVVVSDLKGMVDLRPGRLTIVAVPGPQEGGTGGIDRNALRRQLGAMVKADLVAAHGTGAVLLARRLGFEPLRFAADRGAFNAAERGLASLLFVTRDLLPDLMATLDRLNASTLRRVPVELVDAA